MRVLFLGNSNDRQRPPGMPHSRVELIERLLSREMGEPVTVTWKEAWPNEALPAALERWIERHEPDLLYFAVNGYWYLYDSVPLRLRRRFGPIGRLLAPLAEQAGESHRFAWNPLARGLRAALAATVGGEPHFTPDAVLAKVEECVAVAVRHEGLVIAVRPDWGNTRFARTKRGLARKEHTRLAVQARLEAICRRNHVYCPVFAKPNWQTSESEIEAAGDGIHQATRGLEFTAGLFARSMLEALLFASRPERAAAAESAGRPPGSTGP